MSDLDQDITVTDTDQTSTEEQNYRESMHGVCSFMGWTHIPDIDSTASNAEDNPFASPKQKPVGKLSVNLPTDDWLCSKMDSWNTDTSEVLKQGVCRGTSLSSTVNLMLNGTGSTPARTGWLNLFHSGIVTQPS